MKDDNPCHRFRIRPGQAVRLDRFDPADRISRKSKAAARKETEHYARRLRDLQYQLYAEGRRSLLICLQALDAGGKDGVIRHVLSYMNPQGCRVRAFKQPTPEEATHDFLWRVHQAAPRLGEVAIFNRSHYEDVLVVRVHETVPKKIWRARFDAINAFERQLHANGTHILKFYLHISPEEQLRRFKRRIDDPDRWWKISESDYTERRFWPAYVEAYEEALGRCSTEDAPWYVIPSDHKWVRNLLVSRIVVETMERFGMRLPRPSVDIDDIRRRYHAAAEQDLDT
jgi:PPK2 family polyphosphate:nucleotide phosphotransferase